MGDNQVVKKVRGWGLTIVIPLSILGGVITFLSVLIDIIFHGGVLSR